MTHPVPEGLPIWVQALVYMGTVAGAAIAAFLGWKRKGSGPADAPNTIVAGDIMDTPNPDGSINSGGGNGTSKASPTNPVPTNSPGLIAVVTDTFTRPSDTTAYTAPTGSTPGDLVANSATAGSVAFTGAALSRIDGAGSGVAMGQISRLALREAQAKAPHTIRVHVLIGSVAPTFTNANNGAIAITNLGANLREIGFVDLLMVPGVSGTYGEDDSLGLGYSGTVGTDKLYFVPEAATAFTAQSGTEVWTFDADLQRAQ